MASRADLASCLVRIDRTGRELLAFVVLSYAGAWLLALPLWLSAFRRVDPEQAATPLVRICLYGMMVVPATVAILLTLRRHHWRELPSVLALRPDRPYRRLLLRCLASMLVFVLITSVGLVIAGPTVGYRPGWPEAWGVLPPLVFSALLSVPLYLGEEIGWQGYLVPRLLRFGTVPGLLLAGVIWGPWHLPMTALGGSYPGHSLAVAIPAATVTAVGIGAVIAAIRLRTNSVWPAVAAHLGLNEFALLLPRFLAADGEVPDPLLVGPLAITSWPVLAIAATAGIVAVVRGHRGTRGTDRCPAGRSGAGRSDEKGQPAGDASMDTNSSVDRTSPKVR